MSNKIRDKQKRQRLSLQNQNLVRNQLNLVIENIKKEEEAEVTKEEDPLKYFSQQLRKKEKEKERLKYLKTIKEEDDPLKYFENNENKEEEELDPLKFVKENEEALNDNDEPKVLGNLALHDEEKLAEAIKNNDIPEEIIINKKEEKENAVEEKQKKMHKRMKTALKLSSEGGLAKRLNDKLLQRLKNAINTVNDGEASKITESKKDTGNTLLGAEAQVNPGSAQGAKQTKQIDLSAFMKK